MAQVVEHVGLERLLTAKGIAFDRGELRGYASDASFLTLGVPSLLVFPKDEAECVALVDLAVKQGVPIVPRGTGSSTAGQALAPPNAVLVDMERVGACDARGHRRGLFVPQVVDPKGGPIDLKKAAPEDELYIRVGAGRTSDETNRALKPFKWSVAVTPSSGYSTFGGNFATNARGSGTPAYGPFGEAVSRIRIVASSEEGARVLEVTDRAEIHRLAGHHGLCGLVTELDVRIAPILRPEEQLCAILMIEMADVEVLGARIGELMKRVAASCRYYAGEFLFIDEGILRPDDPVRKDPILGLYFQANPDAKRMVLLYRGRREAMATLPEIAAVIPDVYYREITFPQFQTMMRVRTAATGKSYQRTNVPGCEDFIVRDPAMFGKVLAAMFRVLQGAEGRPVGHHYPDGVVVHFRPQAKVARGSITEAWGLNLRLREAVLRPEFAVEDRVEHGLGLRLFRDSTPGRREELRRLKATYDPANVMCPHLLDPQDVSFVGSQFLV